MPFGLMNAPSSFQEMMDEILRDLDTHAVWYIDDILIYSGHGIGSTDRAAGIGSPAKSTSGIDRAAGIESIAGIGSTSTGIGSPHPTGSEAEHKWAVERVLKRLLDHHLAVNLAKSEFHVKEINFLGYLLGDNTLRMEPGKIEAIQQWEMPTRKKEVQAFLGFANYYRRFIKDYASRVNVKNGSGGESMTRLKGCRSGSHLVV